MSMLNLPQGQIARIRDYARDIAGQVQEHIDRHTTQTVERAVVRLMGLDGANDEGVPYPNVIVDHLQDQLPHGAAAFLANAVLHTGLSLSDIAWQVDAGILDLTTLPMADPRIVADTACRLVEPQMERIAANRRWREEKISGEGRRTHPLLYVIVATGNIYEDVGQAKNAVKSGAEVVAVIRSTAQSLLDYVPYGATTEGFGGTYATQENFRIMREALDEAGSREGRYVRLVNYASGLCMPEIAVMGALERLDMMLNDSMYGILFRDINMYRTFTDQHFSRMVNACAGVMINTGEDNYLTTADAVDKAYTVLASDFINERFAYHSGLTPALMGLGHAFEIDPRLENSFLLELAHAWLVRECFPEHPLKYMPPTKHITGNIFQAYMLNTMFNLAGQMTNQGIQLLGMLTEAIHTPHLQDRGLACHNATYVMNAAKDLSAQFTLKPDSFIVTRAQTVLDQCEDFLRQLVDVGLMQGIEQGLFADVKRLRDGGKGLKGVVTRADDYFNPLFPVFRKLLPTAHVA